jgi:hypothetical protein
MPQSAWRIARARWTIRIRFSERSNGSRKARQNAARAFAFVGIDEVSQSGATIVANHPQSLWITLWTAIRRRRQVALPKGFSFFRSNFERCAFR